MAIEDDQSPMRLQTLADIISLDPKKVFPYAPSSGILPLREAWKSLVLKKNPGLKEPISLPVVTSGLTHALSVIGYLFINPGDRGIVPDLLWENYSLIFEYGCGGVSQYYPTFSNHTYNLEALDAALKTHPGKQIVLLNFPHNPSGYSPTEAEADSIAACIRRSAEKGNTVLVIHDDAYFGLFYEEETYSQSLFSKTAHLHENVLAVKVDGATKEDYAWGFRTGFITYGMKGLDCDAYTALEDKTIGAIRSTISSSCHLAQSALLHAITSPQYPIQKENKRKLLKSRYDQVKKVLSQHSEYSELFCPLPYNSGYFMCVELKQGLESEAVRKRLLDTYDTGVVALGGLLRIAYSSVAANAIPQLFDNIFKACQDLIK
jgi:aspartate/methionine/tyrosine aminotransferase